MSAGVDGCLLVFRRTIILVSRFILSILSTQSGIEGSYKKVVLGVLRCTTVFVPSLTSSKSHRRKRSGSYGALILRCLPAPCKSCGCSPFLGSSFLPLRKHAYSKCDICVLAWQINSCFTKIMHLVMQA